MRPAGISNLSVNASDDETLLMGPQLSLSDGPSSDPIWHRSRLISPLSLIFAFPLSICSLVFSPWEAPGLGIIPHGISAIISCFLVWSRPKPGKLLETSWIENKRALVMLFDLTFAASMLAVLIVSWVIFDDGHGWGAGRGVTALSAYATVPLIVNFVIHTTLGLWNLHRMVSLRRLVAAFTDHHSCPHCNSCPHSWPPSSYGRVKSTYNAPGRDSMAPLMRPRYSDESWRTGVASATDEQAPRVSFASNVESKPDDDLKNTKPTENTSPLDD